MIFLNTILFLLLYLLLAVGPIAGSLYVFYFLLTLPMRRAERARLFLDLLEIGLKAGRSPEVTLSAVSSSRDRALGVRVHLLAAHLADGRQLGEALDAVPRLLPPQLRAMIQTGERIGDVGKVLPACRQLLEDSVSQVRGAVNYLLILTFAVTPASFFVPIFIRIMIVPKFKEVFAGLTEGVPLPPFTRFVFEGQNYLTSLLAGMVLMVWVLMLLYLGGPRIHGWLRRPLPWLADWLVCRLPWRRKRLQRDFSAMLAVLLDAAVPEAEAVALAAQATANVVMIRRGNKVRDLLNRGAKLPQAIEVMDDTPELRWRLSNALHRGSGFLRALAGWHEALDAKAFQMEQTAAQVTTAVLVLLNGAVVAAIVIAVFMPLVELINRATLW
jgi:type IV pilus assembly protein PilC